MFNSVCGEQQPHPARHEAGMEKTRAPNIRGPPRARNPQENHRRDNRGLTQKRAEESPKVGPRQPQCRRPRVPWRQGPQAPPAADHTRADRALGPETQRPPTPQSGPSKASRARPRQATAESGRRSLEHPAPARETTNAPAASSTGRACWWGGGRLRWWVRWSLRPDLTHRRRRTSTHIHRHTFPPSCTQMNIRTFVPQVDTQKWTQYPHSHSPYALYTPRSRHHHPLRGSQRPIPELNPLRSGAGTGRPPRSPQQQRKPTAQTPTGRQLILSAPAQTENREQGCEKKKKKKKTPCFTSPAQM